MSPIPSASPPYFVSVCAVVASAFNVGVLVVLGPDDLNDTNKPSISVVTVGDIVTVMASTVPPAIPHGTTADPVVPCVPDKSIFHAA